MTKKIFFSLLFLSLFLNIAPASVRAIQYEEPIPRTPVSCTNSSGQTFGNSCPVCSYSLAGTRVGGEIVPGTGERVPMGGGYCADVFTVKSFYIVGQTFNGPNCGVSNLVENDWRMCVSPYPSGVECEVLQRDGVNYFNSISPQRMVFSTYPCDGSAPGPIGGDFSISVNPTLRSIAQGATATYNVTVASLSHFDGDVDLTATGCPNGANCSFSPTSVTVPDGGFANSTFTITNTSSVPLATYSMKLTGTSGGLSHYTDAFLVVGLGTNDSSCTMTAPSSVAPGAPFSATVTVNNTGTKSWVSGGANPYRLVAPSGSYSPWVGLGAQNLPSSPIAAGGSTTFNINATAPAASGNYNFVWRMAEGNVAQFGATCTKSIAVTNNPVGSCNQTTITQSFTAPWNPSNAVRCAEGTASVPVQTGANWTWTCSGSGSPAQCSATIDNSNTTPYTPTGFYAAPSSCGTGQINLSWNASAGATGYILRRNGNIIYNGPNLNYSDTGLTAATSYSYSIAASNAYGPSTAATISAISPANCSGGTPPSTPTGLTANPSTCGTGLITLSWNASAGATFYTLRRGPDIVYSGPNRNFNDSGLDPGSSYTYFLTASNSGGASGSTSATANAPAQCAAQPVTVTLTASPTYMVYPQQSTTLIWTTTGNPVQCVGGGSLAGPWQGSKNPPTGGSYTENNLAIGNNTFFLSCSRPGAAANSNIVTVEVAQNSPSTPTGFYAAPGSCGTGEITLNWEASPGATSYTLRRNGSQIYNGSGLTHTDTGLTAGTSYTYTLTASNSSGPSSVATISAIAPSNCGAGGPNASATIRANPSTIPYNTSSTLTWSYSNATDCVITPPAGSPSGVITIPPSTNTGTVSTGNLTASRRYTLTCNPGGTRSEATVTVENASTYRLNVIKSGQGTVRETTLPQRVNCGATCSYDYDFDTAVTLQAQASSGRIFTGWSGDCTGSGNCSIRMNNTKTVYANFAVDPNFREF